VENNDNSRELVWHLVSHLVFIDAPRVVAVTLIKQLVAEPLKTLELLCMLCMTCFLTRDSENKTSQCAVMSKQLWCSCCLLSSAEAQQRRQVDRMDSRSDGLTHSQHVTMRAFILFLTFFFSLSLSAYPSHARCWHTHTQKRKHAQTQTPSNLI